MEKKKSIFNMDVIREKMNSIDDNLGFSIVMLIVFALIIVDLVSPMFMTISDMQLWFEGLAEAYPSSLVLVASGIIGLTCVFGYLCYGLYVCLGNIYRITYNRAQEKAKLRAERQKKESEE